jgi:hypothetical protein
MMAVNIETKCRVVETALSLIKSGTPSRQAWEDAASLYKVHVATAYRWFDLVKEKDRGEWPDTLRPGYKGRSFAYITPAAWGYFLEQYSRSSPPSARWAYQQTCNVADSHGWIVPSERAILRRMDAEGVKKRTRYDRF